MPLAVVENQLIACLPKKEQQRLVALADRVSLLSRVNQGGKRDNQDGNFFEGAFFEPFGSELPRLEAI